MDLTQQISESGASLGEILASVFASRIEALAASIEGNI